MISYLNAIVCARKNTLHSDIYFMSHFCFLQLKDYHSVCHLVLSDVPQLPPEPADKG